MAAAICFDSSKSNEPKLDDAPQLHLFGRVTEVVDCSSYATRTAPLHCRLYNFFNSKETASIDFLRVFLKNDHCSISVDFKFPEIDIPLLGSFTSVKHARRRLGVLYLAYSYAKQLEEAIEMKVHIDKNKTEERNRLTQLLRIASATECYEIHAWYELNDQEKRLLEKDPRLKDKILFDYEYNGSDLSPSVNMMVDREDDGFRFVAYSARELNDLEEKIKDRAETLKYRIAEISDTEGSSTTQI